MTTEFDRRFDFSVLESFYHTNSVSRIAFATMAGLLLYFSQYVDLWKIGVLAAIYLTGAIGLEIVYKQNDWLESGDPDLARRWRNRYLPWVWLCGLGWGLLPVLCYVPGKLEYLSVAYMAITVVVFGNLSERVIDWFTFITTQTLMVGGSVISLSWLIWTDFHPTRLVILIGFLLCTWYATKKARVWHRHELIRIRAVIEAQIAQEQLADSHNELKEAYAELERVATTDRLTGLYNRVRLDERFSGELRRSTRYGHSLSVILMDIDHFKEVNDRFGHQIGDQVLQDVAGTVRNTIRQLDIAGRWGGEEFMVICPETGLEAAAGLANRIRQSIERYDFAETGKQTCSFGVASYVEGDTEAALLRRADGALYRAKRDGRNLVRQEADNGSLNHATAGEGARQADMTEQL